MPVIGCAECLTQDDEPNFFFAGVCACQSLAHRTCHSLAPTWPSSHHTPLPQQAGRRRCGRPTMASGRRLTRHAAQIATSSVLRPPSHRAISPAQFFTLSLGGMVTVSAPAYRPALLRASDCAPRAHRHALSDAQLLNTSSASIFAGDLVEWSLSYDKAAMSNAKRARHGPRRIGWQTPPRTLQLAARVLTLVLFDVRYPDGDRV